MPWPFHNIALANYWLKIFGLYALTEACIQLLFNYILNRFSAQPISNIEFHSIMWVFQCVLIWTIWWVAYSVRKKPVAVQALVNVIFFIVYSYFWFGPVQEIIRYLHQHLQQVTLPETRRLQTPVDSATNLGYQFLKHAFRLSWFFLANYFYNYRREEEQRLQLAVANKDLQMKLLKWYLNPDFYFRTISYLRQLAAISPSACTRPILQLARVMEYVIYETREKIIDVSKEVRFLNDYLQLINRQVGQGARFTINTEGEHDKLKIAPLLLAGFIDKIVSAKDGLEDKSYAIGLQFSGNRMLFRIEGNLNGYNDTFLRPDDSLYKRITELYADRFSYKEIPCENYIELRLQLNEQ